MREAGAAAGDDVVVPATAGVRVEVERAEDLVRRYAGSLPRGTYPPCDLNESRDEWRP
jgi:hypothetical protein